MHMSETQKVESLLDSICSEVCDAIRSDLELARRFASESEELSGIKWILKTLDSNENELFHFLINAAALSDLLTSVILTLQSSDDISNNVDFDFVAQLLSPSMHRFELIDEYRQFQDLSSSSDLVSLLLWWSKDEKPFGGDRDSGALYRPLQTLCFLSGCITRDTKVFNAYATAIKLFTRLILQSKDFNPSNQSVYNSNCQILDFYESMLQKRIRLIDIAMEIEKFEDEAQS